MELKEVKSSNIKAIGKDGKDLIVEYIRGAKYRYKNVPENLFEDLEKAESKGRYIGANVKGKYEYEKM